MRQKAATKLLKLIRKNNYSIKQKIHAMKNVMILAISLLSFGSLHAQTKSQVKVATSKSKDADGIDGRMKGPKGEKVYIGEKGGRYYINEAGNRIYLKYGKKNATKKELKKIIKSISK